MSNTRKALEPFSPLSDLVPDIRNVNKHTQRGTALLEDSLRKHGAGQSILIDRNNKVIAGNATLEGAASIGLEDVQIVESDGKRLIAVKRTDIDLETPEGRELALLDNRTSEVNLEWDVEVLAQFKDEGVDLSGLWNDDELEELLEAGGGGGIIGDPDEIPENVETRCKYGDLWSLGSHRLLCGDSTKAEDVGRLMGGGKASLCMTSPPYFVGKEYEREKTWEQVVSFVRSVSENLVTATAKRIVINTGAPQAAHLTGERAHTRLLLDEWISALYVHGWLMRYVRIWAKRGGLAHTAPQSDCIDQHWEFIAVFYLPSAYEGQRRLGEKWATDGIWDDVVGTMNEAGHCASFPVEIPSRNIRLYTDRSELIYEPFIGAGTTLIAAEQLGRKCYGLEIEPKYVDVCLARWEAATGKQAELVEHGSSD